MPKTTRTITARIVPSSESHTGQAIELYADDPSGRCWLYSRQVYRAEEGLMKAIRSSLFKAGLDIPRDISEKPELDSWLAKKGFDLELSSSDYLNEGDMFAFKPLHLSPYWAYADSDHIGQADAVWNSDGSEIERWLESNPPSLDLDTSYLVRYTDEFGTLDENATMTDRLLLLVYMAVRDLEESGQWIYSH